MTSITQERRGLDQVGGPRLRRREEWKARRSYRDARTVVEPADHQFIHITVSNPRSYSSNDAHARAIEAIGIARFPNTGISYNRGVMYDGALYEFQPIGRRGAHTVNNKNRRTCNTSGCPSKNTVIRDPRNNLNYNVRAYVFCQNVGDRVSDTQVDNIAQALAADILAGFVKRGATLHGHRCVAWKDCPADKVWARMDDIERLRDRYVAEGFNQEDAMTPEDRAYVDAQFKALGGLIERRTGHLPDQIKEIVHKGVVGYRNPNFPAEMGDSYKMWRDAACEATKGYQLARAYVLKGSALTEAEVKAIEGDIDKMYARV